MSDRIRIVKRSGRWFTLGAEQAQSHPTFELAMRHARHLAHTEKHNAPLPEHLQTRINDLCAWGWTVDSIADATGVPLDTVSTIATESVFKLRAMKLPAHESRKLAHLYQKECVA